MVSKRPDLRLSVNLVKLIPRKLVELDETIGPLMTNSSPNPALRFKPTLAFEELCFSKAETEQLW